MAIPVPYSYREYTGDGVAKDFSVPFPYLQRVHVKVYLDQKLLVDGTDYNWTSDTQIELTVAPQAAVTGTTPKPAEVLTVLRETPEDLQIVQWKDGSYIIADDLNESDLQWLYLIQEHHDRLLRAQYNLGPLPGGTASGKFWNQLARHLDPDKGTASEQAQTVDSEDQKKPDATGLASDGWVADDKHVATTGAISERLDPFVQDTKPADPPITDYRQAGKFWVDNGLLQFSYWEPSAKAWVNLGTSGPPGPPGPPVTIKGELPAGPWTPPPNPSAGDLWLAAGVVTGFPGGDLQPGHGAQFDGTNWVDVGKIQGPAGTPATVSVGTTTTLAPGASATVSNSGTASAAIFDFGIPQGPKGDKGDAAALTPATSTTLGGVKVGTGLSVTVDGTLSTTNAGTVTSVTGTAPITSSGGATPAIGITAATTSAAGSMSAADKTKLDGIAADANNYVLPAATAGAIGGVKTGTNIAIATDGTISANLPGALIYKGTADLTAAAPATKAQGDVYVNTTAGTIDASWTGLTGTVAAGEMVLWDGAKWDKVGTSGSAGVTSITGTTPIVIGGTAAAPDVQVTAATTAANGVVRLADGAAVTAGTAGRVVDAAQLKTTNDNLATAISNALPDAPDGTAAGTLQYVRQVVTAGTGTLTQTKTWAPISVNIPDASDTVKGLVELATDAETVTGTDTTRAVTPANAAAVYLPLDFDTLTVLP